MRKMNHKITRSQATAQYPKALLLCNLPFQRNCFSGRGPLFDTPEDDAKAAAAATALAEREALIDAAAAKAEERVTAAFKRQVDGISGAVHKLTTGFESLKSAGKKDEKEPDPNSVAAIRAEIEAGKAEAAQEKIEAKTKSLLGGLKLTPGTEEFAEAYLEKAVRGKIEYDRASKKVLVSTVDELKIETKQSYDDFFAGLVKAGKFKSFEPQTPSAKNAALGKESGGPQPVNILGWKPVSKQAARVDPDKFAALIGTDEGKQLYSGLPEK